MSIVKSEIETTFGRGDILIPDINFEDLGGYEPTYKILDLFRRFSLVNDLIMPPDRHKGLPNFEYEFVVPADDNYRLTLVNGIRRVKPEAEIADARYSSNTNRFNYSSRSKGYKVASEIHRLAEAPDEPGSFVTRILVDYGQYEGGFSMGGASVPTDSPTITHDGTPIFPHDSNAEQECREVFETFYEVLGTN